MEELVKSFGKKYWRVEEYNKKYPEEFNLWTEDPTGKHMIEYIDHGGSSPDKSNIDINFYIDNKLDFVFRQQVSGNKIENHIIVAPFKDEYFDPEWGYGVHYWPDGRMGPVRDVPGLPRKIDMDITVTLFLRQVIEGRFNKPLLIRSG